MAQRIIVDTDIGTDVDDAYALALLASSPEVKMEGVTTVWADATLRARIARKLLNLLGKQDVPVAVGENLPLDRQRPAFLMGHEGRGVFDGNEKLPLSDIPALALIESLLRKYPREIKLVLIGPLTNIGKLLTQEPDLASLVKEFVIMGGMPFYGPREIKLFGERQAEYNFFCDPEAAQIVFSSGAPITMVGANVTIPTLLKGPQIDLVGKRGTPTTDLLYAMTTEWLTVIGKDETSMHDPLAVAAAFTLDFLDTMMLNVAIETKGELTAGLTVINHYEHEEWNTVRVATEVRSDDFIKFMLGRILG